MVPPADRIGRLQGRWLADSAEVAPEAGDELWEAECVLLSRGWSEPHRSYHTLEHLAEMLGALDELELAGELESNGQLERAGGLERPGEFGAEPSSVPEPPTPPAVLARIIAWYHDLAYDPRATAGSNEHRSAMLARDHLHRLGVDSATVDAVEAGVLMTAGHDPQQMEKDELSPAVADAVHDADLWILSAPEPRYAAYIGQVRNEYRHVPDPAFRAGRAQILAGFANRDRIYRTRHARANWENRARRNLEAELASIQGDS